MSHKCGGLTIRGLPCQRSVLDKGLRCPLHETAPTSSNKQLPEVTLAALNDILEDSYPLIPELWELIYKRLSVVQLCKMSFLSRHHHGAIRNFVERNHFVCIMLASSYPIPVREDHKKDQRYQEYEAVYKLSPAGDVVKRDRILPYKMAHNVLTPDFEPLLWFVTCWESLTSVCKSKALFYYETRGPTAQIITPKQIRIFVDKFVTEYVGNKLTRFIRLYPAQKLNTYVMTNPILRTPISWFKCEKTVKYIAARLRRDYPDAIITIASGGHLAVALHGIINY